MAAPRQAPRPAPGHPVQGPPTRGIRGCAALLPPLLVVLAPLGLLAAAPEVVIDEIMYHPADPDERLEYVEILNRGDARADLGGFFLAEGISFRFPDGTTLEPGAYLVVCRSASAVRAVYGIGNAIGDFGGRLANGGERVTLLAAEGDRADSVEYGDEGWWPRAPDGEGPSLECIDPARDNEDPRNWAASRAPDEAGTPGRTNSVDGAPPVPGMGDVVINEILYNVPAWAGGDPEREYVELYNGGAARVELEGWAFTDGIRYTFRAGEGIEPGGFFLLCRNPSAYPDVAHRGGPFEGRLDDRGERLTLLGGGRVPRVADTIAYDDGWSWPKEADGTGLTLQRRNPRSPATHEGNWEASLPRDAACMRIVATGGGTGRENGIRRRLPVRPPQRARVTLSFWARSISGSRSLRIRFSGARPDTGVGVFGTPELTPRWRYYERTAEAPSDTVYLYLLGPGECLVDDVRIARGTQVLLHSGFEEEPTGWSATGNHAGSGRDTSDHMASDLGTPGGPNSVLTGEAPLPRVRPLRRWPDAVTSDDAVEISIEVRDAADPEATLLWDAGRGFQELAMEEETEAAPGAAVFSASIPPRPHGTLVRWYVHIRDGTRAIRYPRDAPSTVQAYYTSDGEVPSRLPVYRIVISPGSWIDLTSRDVFSDDLVDAFFVHGSDARQVGLRYRGGVHSRRDRKKPFRVRFDSDRPFTAFPEMGEVVRMNLNADHLDRSLLRTAFAYGFLRDEDLRVPRAQHVHLRLDRGEGDEFLGVYTQVEPVDDRFLARPDNFGDDAGNLYKALWVTWEFKGWSPDAYRREFEKSTNEEEEDWRDLIALFDVVWNRPAAEYPSTLEPLLDIESFLAYMVHNVALGAWDNYIIFPHNFFLYNNPTAGRFFWIPWDYDEVLQPKRTYMGSDIAASPPLYLTGKILSVPAYWDEYRLRMETLLHDGFTEENIIPRIDALYEKIREDVYRDTYKSATNAQFEAEIDAMKKMFRDRRAYLLSLLPRAPEFRRGDANGDGTIDVGDAICALTQLFGAAGEDCRGLRCLDAADANDDGALDIADAIGILEFIFAGGAGPPAPGAKACGPDPTGDPPGSARDLGCDAYDACP